MRLTIDVELSEKQLEYWVGYAVMHNLVANTPNDVECATVEWTKEELERVVKFAIVQYVMGKGK